MTRSGSAKPHPSVRCAIYTRKSTEEGLDQEFNTLDAQRESGEAYIKSQTHEGWRCLAERYDDGGFSGGTMERPALKRLLAEIDAGRIDCIVVYKVDRLSRSLLDFARILETFERFKVAFVSVTQQFNTGTSMGRLLLNVLLSFAQFEREMISERTRDKIAATRKKGTGSVLSINALPTINASGGYVQIYATAGGDVNLNALTTINAANGYYVRLRSDGSGSSLSIPNVTTLQSAIVEVWNSGAMTTSQLTSATLSTIDVRNAAPNFNALTNVTGSTVNVYGTSTLNLTAVTAANGSSFGVYEGNSLNLPGVTSITSSGNPYWQADGTGSVLSINALPTINASGGYVQIYATAGGDVNLNALTTINAANGYYVRLRSDGSGSRIDAPVLTTINGGLIDPRENGRVALPAGTVTATQSTISTATGGTVEVGTLVLQAATLLYGDGNGIGNVVNTAGRVAPGLSPGILTLPGTYSQGNAGTLVIEVGGPVIGTDTDRLVVGGAATIGGKLEVTLAPMFSTTLGTTYDVLTASAVNASFSVSTGRLVNPQIFLGIQYLADRVRLKGFFRNVGDLAFGGC